MELQDKYNDIEFNLNEYQAYYYPKSSFSSQEIEELSKYFDIREFKMDKQNAQEIEGLNENQDVDWTQEWYYLVSNYPKEPSKESLEEQQINHSPAPLEQPIKDDQVQNTPQVNEQIPPINPLPAPPVNSQFNR